MNPTHFRTLMELAGLTQAEVATHAGKTERTVRYWTTSHEAPLAMQEWVRECWREVRDTARALAESRTEDGEVLLSRTPMHDAGWEYGEHWTPGMDAAVTRLALALLEVGGAEVTVA